MALLAGISVEYYTRLERGSVGSVSEGVLDGLVHALQLDEAERDHLYRLVRTAAAPGGRRAPRRFPARKRVRPSIEYILDQMPMPAYLRNGRFDVLAANDLGRALYSPLYEQADAGEHPNRARFLFLDPAAPEFFVDYDKTLNDCVAFLRAEAGRDPYDKELSELVGELSTRGEDPGQRLNVDTAPPDSPSAEALGLLASWSARQPVTTPAPTPAPTPAENEDTWNS